MNSQSNPSLLAQHDPSPAQLFNVRGRASFLLIGDHAGNAIPAALGTLGIDAGERQRHIAWDIGIATLGELLAARLDASFVRQAYSRLVVDCNRDAAAPDAIAEVSDGTAIPGNQDLSAADRAARFAEIHEPYHQAIAAALARLDTPARLAPLVALHSFTPAMGGRPRPWQVGILHDRGNTALSRAMLGWLQAQRDLTVGDNEPYAMDGIDYTVPRHAYPQRPYVEIEVRQDLLGSPAGCAEWAARLAAALTACLPA